MKSSEQIVPYDPQPGDYVWTTEIAPGTDVEVKRGASYVRVMRECKQDKTMVEVEYGAYFDRAVVSKASCTFAIRGEAPSQDWIDRPPMFT